MDTIYALATAPGKAGVAIIRVSGPSAFSAAEALTGGAVGIGFVGSQRKSTNTSSSIKIGHLYRVSGMTNKHYFVQCSTHSFDLFKYPAKVH